MLGGAFVAVAVLVPPLLMYGNKGLVIALFFLGIPSVAWVIGTGAWRQGGDRWVLATGGALLLWGWTSLGWAALPALVTPKVLQLTGLSVLGLMSCQAAATLDGNWGRRVLAALAAGFAVAALAALVEASTALGLSRAFRPLLTGTEWQPGSVEMSTFKNLGAAGVPLAVATLGAGVEARRWAVAGTTLLATLAVIVVTRSYTGAVALALALMVLATPFQSARRLTLAGTTLLAACVPLAAHLPGSAILAPLVPWLPNSLMHRVEIWRFAAARAWERPLLGWGLDGSREIPGGGANVVVWLMDGGRLISFPSQVLPLHPHDFLLQIWLELGFVGLALAMAVIAALLRTCRSSGQVAAIAAAITVAVASYSLWQSWWVATLWLTASLAMALSRHRRKLP